MQPHWKICATNRSGSFIFVPVITITAHREWISTSRPPSPGRFSSLSFFWNVCESSLPSSRWHTQCYGKYLLAPLCYTRHQDHIKAIGNDSIFKGLNCQHQQQPPHTGPLTAHWPWHFHSSLSTEHRRSCSISFSMLSQHGDPQRPLTHGKGHVCKARLNLTARTATRTQPPQKKIIHMECMKCWHNDWVC